MSWAAGESGCTEPGSSGWPGPVSAFPAMTEDEEVLDTDSATPSDTGTEELPAIPGLENMPQAKAAELIYFPQSSSILSTDRLAGLGAASLASPSGSFAAT